jgi:hypothetical protein
MSLSSWKHAAWKYPYRSPAPNGMLEKSLSAVGGLFRAVGEALDEFGAILQGPGALKETGETGTR